MSMKQQKQNNHTGTAISPGDVKAMVDAARETGPTSSGSHRSIVEARISYIREAEPVGTLPPPGNAEQFQHTAARAASEQVMEAFIDKLGARLAFERNGVRLYEGLMSKHEASGGFPGGPSMQDLQHICDQEFQHFRMLRECIEQLGGDPTAVTPAADVETTAGMGIEQVMMDPRTDLVQCLDAILVAELADNASWEHLRSLAQQAGVPGMADQFGDALAEEQEHLRMVQGWISAAAKNLAA